MKTIGMIISNKPDEKRRMILPDSIKNVKNKEALFFEKSYGESIGIDDEEYISAGCNVVSRDEILKCDVIVDRKLGDADYLDDISDGKILVGAAHAIQTLEFTSNILNHNHTVVATEEMFYGGRYLFYLNNELAGQAAVIQSIPHFGKLPCEAKIAILGNGSVAKGALRILDGLGAKVDVFGRKFENLFKEKMFEYDVLINAIKWDTNRTDKIIYKTDLKKMRKGTMIIDVSCDPGLEIETSHPTTISNPTYVIDDVIHYAVDNTPSLFPLSATKIMSDDFAPFLDCLVDMNPCDYPDILRNATVIQNGHIVDERIRDFRNKKGLFCK